MTVGSYIPLIGGDNVAAVFDPTGILLGSMTVGTINAVAAEGRSGSLRTSLLVALDEASVQNVPATTAALLFSVKVACPPGFSTPATANLVGFDYSQLMPDVHAECLAGGFLVPGGVWPSTIEALVTAEAAFAANTVSIVGRLVDVGYPTAPGANPAYPYGTLTYAFTGAATVAAVNNALISVSFDFGASVAS